MGTPFVDVRKRLYFSINAAIYKLADAERGSQFPHKTQKLKAMAVSLKITA